jgi:hypothetical protein
MNDDYLWDKSGPPDPEIQVLEATLDDLKFRPKGLKLALLAPPSRTKRDYTRHLAIAATLAIMLSSGFLFWHLRGDRPLERTTVVKPGVRPDGLPPTEQRTIALTDDQQEILNSTPSNQAADPGSSVKPKPKSPSNTLASTLTKRRYHDRVRDTQVVEGERAKEQLMLALRVASAKLNMAQKYVAANKGLGPSS